MPGQISTFEVFCRRDASDQLLPRVLANTGGHVGVSSVRNSGGACKDIMREKEWKEEFALELHSELFRLVGVTGASSPKVQSRVDMIYGSRSEWADATFARWAYRLQAD